MSEKEAKFEIRKSDKDTNQPYYFVLIAPNDKIIAKSEMYLSKQACTDGVQSVKDNAPNATIVDVTGEKK
jgi:uncharacterized protein YegP (UPF0339 family)